MGTFTRTARARGCWWAAGALSAVVLAASSVSIASPAAASTSSTVRLAATTSLLYGGTGTVSGRVLSGGSGVGGVRVVVYYRPAGTDEWAGLTRTRTTRTGRFKVSTQPGRNTRYFARFRGTSSHGAASSLARRTLVSPLVTLDAAAGPVIAGQSVTLTTKVVPSHPSRTITYQWLDPGGVWRNVGTGTLSSASQHMASFSIPNVATYWFRVGLPAHSDHAEGRAVEQVIGVASTATPPPPTAPPPPSSPAVYEARDSAPNGRPPAVQSAGGYVISAGTSNCANSGSGRLTVTGPGISDSLAFDHPVFDYYRNNFFTWDPSIRVWTYVSSSRWMERNRLTFGTWIDYLDGTPSDPATYTVTTGLYWGVTQSVIDSWVNLQYEVAVTFLTDPSPYYACRA
jgi:hypothetical protein